MRRVVLAFGLLVAGCEGPEERPDWLDDLDEDEVVRPNLADIRLAPSPLDFGEVAPGTSATRPLEVENDGDVPVDVIDVILLPAGEDVTLAMKVHEDIIRGLTLYPGDVYTFDVKYRPGSGTPYSGNLEVWFPGGASKAVRVTGGGAGL